MVPHPLLIPPPAHLNPPHPQLIPPHPQLSTPSPQHIPARPSSLITLFPALPPPSLTTVWALLAIQSPPPQEAHSPPNHSPPRLACRRTKPLMGICSPSIACRPLIMMGACSPEHTRGKLVRNFWPFFFGVWDGDFCLCQGRAMVVFRRACSSGRSIPLGMTVFETLHLFSKLLFPIQWQRAVRV